MRGGRGGGRVAGGVDPLGVLATACPLDGEVVAGDVAAGTARAGGLLLVAFDFGEGAAFAAVAELDGGRGSTWDGGHLRVVNVYEVRVYLGTSTVLVLGRWDQQKA